MPSFGSYEAALAAPIDSLPQTIFPHLNDTGGYIAPVRPDSRSSRFSPMPTRDHQQDVQEEATAITTQVRPEKSKIFLLQKSFIHHS